MKITQFDYMAEVKKIITKAAKIAIESKEFDSLKESKDSIKESIAENLLEELD